MRKLLLALFLLMQIHFISARAQSQTIIDSLARQLPHLAEDSSKLRIYEQIIEKCRDIDPPAVRQFEELALALVTKLNQPLRHAWLELEIGRSYWRMGDFQTALRHHQNALTILKALDDQLNIAGTTTMIGQDFADAGDYEHALSYFDKALRMYREQGNREGEAGVHTLYAFVYFNQGLFAEATKHNFEALKIYDALGDTYGAAIIKFNIAGNYVESGKPDQALQYYMEGMDEIRKKGDNINLSLAYNDVAKVYLKSGRNELAIENHHKALEIAESVRSPATMAMAYTGLGDVYQAEGNTREALSNYLSAYRLLDSVSNKDQIAMVCNLIGNLFMKTQNYAEADRYLDIAYQFSKELNNRAGLIDFYNGRQSLDSINGDWKNAYFNYKYYILNRDSVYNKENSKKIMQTQLQYDFDKKEAAAKAEQEKKDIRQKNIRNSITGVLGGSLIFLVVVFRQRNKISKAKKRSDELLLNILPAETAEELKMTGTTAAKDFDNVTVMFTDFKNFTSMSEQLSAQELVNEIHYCYSAFDGIIERFGMEKIKTIGDSYMCACGLPVPNEAHAEQTIRAALAIRDFMQAESDKRKAAGKLFFEIRIGCNSGPVVAGIVGIKKFAYDIWGDTVNIASRMESSGETGKVNISGSTYALVKDLFNCTYRGKIEAKNKGMIDMYFVEHGNA